MATPVPSLELDPIFVRALKLLHSKAKDSAEQLKQMLDDVLQQKPISAQPLGRESKTPHNFLKESESSKLPGLKKSSPKHLSEHTSSGKKDDVKKKEADKRNIDKLKSDFPEPASEAKRLKLESPKLSPCPSPPLSKLEIKKESDESDDGNTDADDFAMEMGLACVVCRIFEVSSGNRLIECQECHSLYHQECHKPPITDQDVSDPRLVWYCAKCTKNIKKLASKTQKSSKLSHSSSSKDAPIILKTTKSEVSLQIPQLFKRLESKPSLSSSNSGNNNGGNNGSNNSGNKPTGLAGLAASLVGRPPAKVSPTAIASKQQSTKPTPNPLAALSKATASSTSSTIQALKPSPLPNLTSSVKSGASSSSSSTQASKSAAVVSSSSTSSKNSNSGNNNSNKASSSSSLMSADKRLQIMKKKAEKKMQEKRWHSK